MSTPRAPATPSAPSTPAAQTLQQSTPSGSWKHPKFDEIARRQYATTFDERNVRAIIVNAGFLYFSMYPSTVTSKGRLLEYGADSVMTVVHKVPLYWLLILLLRFALAVNIALAFRPLVLRYWWTDDIADIPLTPSQRASMGLNPDVRSPVPTGSQYASPNYVTPPRYQRSTPRSDSYSQDRNSQSPLTGSPRGGFAQSGSNSPFSPGMSTGSPLFQKAMGGSATKRLSYGGSPMGGSSLFGDSSSSAAPGTPTPSTGKATVGLNNKWLYEKRRDSPRTGILS